MGEKKRQGTRFCISSILLLQPETSVTIFVVILDVEAESNHLLKKMCQLVQSV